MANGVTVTVALVPNPLLHAYVPPPLAVKVTGVGVPPAQIVS